MAIRMPRASGARSASISTRSLVLGGLVVTCIFFLVTESQLTAIHERFMALERNTPLRRMPHALLRQATHATFGPTALLLDTCPADEPTSPIDWEPTSTAAERTQLERLLRPSARARAFPTYSEILSAAGSDLRGDHTPGLAQAAGGDTATSGPQSAAAAGQPVAVLLEFRDGPTLCRQLRALLSQRGGPPRSIFVDAFGAGVDGADVATRLAESVDPTGIMSVFTAVGSFPATGGRIGRLRLALQTPELYVLLLDPEITPGIYVSIQPYIPICFCLSSLYIYTMRLPAAGPGAHTRCIYINRSIPIYLFRSFSPPPSLSFSLYIYN